jgi:putative endonuclease
MATAPTTYWVYALRSDRLPRFYIGLAEDVDARLRQHNQGRSQWTARYRPWRCVFRRAFPNLTEARQFENLLKRQKGGRGFYQHTGLTPTHRPAS